MPFAVHSRTRDLGEGREAHVWVLEGDGALAEVWPKAGFNCYKWQIQRESRTFDLLYADPDFFNDGRPTRSGIPILFPFPNRIRDGRFDWEGKEFHLPLNDGPKKNAIHGFTTNHFWQIAGSGADDKSAWVTGAFQSAVDHPELSDLWPSDFEIRVTYRLTANGLRIEVEAHNPDTTPLPFGLGFHPYFRMPFTPGIAAESCTVQVPALSLWELHECLPSGEKQPVDDARNLNFPRRFTDLQLDDVLTELPTVSLEGELQERGRFRAGGATLRVLCSDGFREMVVFTPGHKQAFCLEPYTCATDAVNLQARGIDAGWLTLPPGGRWTGVVAMQLKSDT